MSLMDNQRADALNQETFIQLKTKFLQNEIPIYYLDWAPYIMIGMDPYINNFHSISRLATFEKVPFNGFVSNSSKYDHDASYVEDLNVLLACPQVRDYIQSHGKGKLLSWIINETSERLAAELGLEICLSPVALRKYWDNKANGNRLAEMVNVPCVPYVISALKNYQHLSELTVHLGNQLVIQQLDKSGGVGTFFISNEAEFMKYEKELTRGEEMRIMRRINGLSIGLEACVTQHGIVVGPLTNQLIGMPKLTTLQGGWVGNELYADAFPITTRLMAQQYTIQLGEQLQKLGYKGYFQPDFLVDVDTAILYLGELNLRFSGFTPLTNHSKMSIRDIPLLLLHLAEWLNWDYNLNVKRLNEHWLCPVLGDDFSLVFVSNTQSSPVKSVKSGIYCMNDVDNIKFQASSNIKEIQNENEFFWLSLSDIEQEIEFEQIIGALFMNCRATINGHDLTSKIDTWLQKLIFKN
jgi:hypothetical protein